MQKQSFPITSIELLVNLTSNMAGLAAQNFIISLELMRHHFEYTSHIHILYTRHLHNYLTLLQTKLLYMYKIALIHPRVPTTPQYYNVIVIMYNKC